MGFEAGRAGGSVRLRVGHRRHPLGGAVPGWSRRIHIQRHAGGFFGHRERFLRYACRVFRHGWRPVPAVGTGSQALSAAGGPSTVGSNVRNLKRR